jgi:hypothetical protein
MPDYEVLAEADKPGLDKMVVAGLRGIEAYVSDDGLLICFADAQRFCDQYREAHMLGAMHPKDYTCEDTKQQQTYVNLLLSLRLDTKILGLAVMRDHGMDAELAMPNHILAILTMALGRPPTFRGTPVRGFQGMKEDHLASLLEEFLYKELGLHTKDLSSPVTIPAWAVAALCVAQDRKDPTLLGFQVVSAVAGRP